MVQGKSTAKRTRLRKPGPSGVQLGEQAARGMVMAGAALLFANRGVRAVSVEDILAHAGISRRTFYRLYKSKEDVVEALYRFGTDRLLEGCRAAVAHEREPVRQIERFIDAHLRNVSELGRLVFVLGGEAQRGESSLHARRMEVHAELVKLLEPISPNVDPLLARSLILALEGVVRIMLEESDEGRKVTPAGIERVRRVMMRIATAAVAGTGPGVAPLPPLK
jgi:AcrR family transcriptional regulator